MKALRKHPSRPTGLRSTRLRVTSVRMKKTRGYSLLMTIVLLGALASAIAVMAAVSLGAAKTNAEMVTRRKSFYVCDGMTRILTKLSGDYLSQATSPNETDLETFLCDAGGGTCPALPDLLPSGYAMQSFDVTVPGVTTAPVPSGPFQDMNARQTTVALEFRIQKNGTGFACEQTQEVTLAQIGLFQFFVFAEEYVDVFNGPTMNIAGRVHVNGDFCGSRYWFGAGQLTIETLTASGDIYAGGGACPRYEITGMPDDFHVIDKDSGNPEIVEPANDHTCTACGAQTWAEYSRAHWGGNLLDSDNNVPVLKVPVIGTPDVQDGRDSNDGIRNNSATQRFLVDPIVDDTESSSTMEQRFAFKADLRIINGVWYLANPDDRDDWPGDPIWSDHPGAFNTTATGEEGLVGEVKNVGQSQIRANYGYAGIPNRYSFYEYDDTTNTLVLNNDGVISYGSLFRSTGPDLWRPGFLVHRDADQAPVASEDPDTYVQPRMCSFKDAGGAVSDDLGDFSMVDAWSHPCFACAGPPGTVDSDCSDANETGIDLAMAKFLEATRMGFKDKRLELGANAAEARVLPINFDVAQLAAALQDTDPGELGWHLASRAAPFNGIVYIASSWPNQMQGLGNNGGGSFPARWPNNGLSEPGVDLDPTQARHMTDHTDNGGHFADEDWANSALPYALCSGDPDTLAGGLGYSITGTAQRIGFSMPRENVPNVVDGFEPYFTIPNCNEAETSINLSRPNAVRIINAEQLSTTAFPDGLTIATNLPAYLLGHTNKHSTDTPADWRPLLVAADAITFLSREWDDGVNHWNASIPTDGTDPVTSLDTHYQLAVLAGDVATSNAAWGGGINNFPRFVEDWGEGTEETTIVGSMVIGFRSVFHTEPWSLSAYGAPERTWSYDTNFNDVFNQPPGAPQYNIEAVRRWSAD